MELSVQDWLIVIGAILIVGVLLDAYRRYRSESRNPIRMSRKPGFWKLGDGFREDAELPAEPKNAELPNGGARKRSRDASGEVPEFEPPPPRPVPRQEPRLEPRLEPRVEPPVEPRLEPRFDSPVEMPPEPPRREPAPRPQQASLPGTEAAPLAPRAQPQAEAPAPSEEVVVIHALARQPEGFAGEALLQIFEACDVRHGEMAIFHRHEEEKGRGAVQFSVANVTRPGSFDIDALAGSSVPGLSFFLRLPGPGRPLEAFDCMLETARVVARNLDGELQDESHSVFTTQTAEHCRQRIREFVHRSSPRARR